MKKRPRNLYWELAQKFSDHYYPTLKRLGAERDKVAPVPAIMKNMKAVLQEKGLEGLKESVVKNYVKHLGEISGEREGRAFLETVTQLLAELVLTGAATP